MEIVRIFEDISEEKSLLWGVVYEDGNSTEYDRLLDLWNDVEYLEQFFTDNSYDLDTVFWGHMSVEEAVEKTLEEAEQFEEMINALAHNENWNDKKHIGQIFSPLVKQDFDTRNKKKYKSRPDSRKPFLRFYAVRLEDDTYVISGGAIKLTEQMDGNPHLEKEKRKLEQVKDYLKANGIAYLEDLTT